MQLNRDWGHLTYCSNIHPGESWHEHFARLQQSLPIIKARLSPNTPFGIGLRLSAQAAKSLSQTDTLNDFKQWLLANHFYVFTINGFPYGQFHDVPVKEAVYRPHWGQAERLEYTLQLVDILSALLPDNVDGSISTLPCAFKPDVNESVLHELTHNLYQFALYARQVENNTGKVIRLAIEPEPSCLLETVDDTIAFFKQHIFSPEAVDQYIRLARDNLAELTPQTALDDLQKYIGVCLDTCHSAVMFENVVETATQLRSANININKIQLTAALQAQNIDAEIVSYFSQLSDAVYLHQTCCRDDQNTDFFLDLPAACERFQQNPDSIPAQEWRVHYHVPVFLENLERLKTTSNELRALLLAHARSPFSPHLEVETYTFEVLPEGLKLLSLEENITREMQWVLDLLTSEPQDSERQTQ